MSRSGYSDSCDGWALIRWRGAVASSIRGKRGQAFLQELADALDAMPEKKLIAHSFGEEGAYCTLGVIGASRGAEMPVVQDDYGYGINEEASKALGIPLALASEVMYLNDDAWYDETPEHRWERMRKWVDDQLAREPPHDHR